MSAARKLLEDLVEKRLWPVALLLVVAAIAVPVVIGAGGSESAATEPVAAARAPVASATPAVELVGPPAVRSRPGQVRDPFRRPKPKAAKSDSSATSASGGGASSGGAATGGAKAGSVSGQATPTKATPSKAIVTRRVAPVESAAAIAARSTYETVAHFVGARLNYEHVLAGLAVFGGTASPALQYLGVAAGGEYAIFLLGPDATAAGDDGACVVADPCRAIGLRQGETLHVSVADGRLATPRRYTLKVTSLRHVRKASRALAMAQRGRVAVDGRRVLRTLVKDAPTAAALRQMRYVAATGTVVLVDAP